LIRDGVACDCGNRDRFPGSDLRRIFGGKPVGADGIIAANGNRQTSDKAHGQIYVPFTNWTLYLAVVYLVFTFQSSSNLAAAYGIAVTER